MSLLSCGIGRDGFLKRMMCLERVELRSLKVKYTITRKIFIFYLLSFFFLNNATSMFFLTKGLAFHVTANFYIIGFLTGWLQMLTVTGCHLACDGCKKKPCL